MLNVTSKCNLSCGYCYEYGEDKIVEASTKPRFMNEATAKQSVDFMFSESGDSPSVNLTFFGGETLLNFKMLQSALAYAKDKGRALGKQVNASLTTNATLLREEVIDWIVENDVGVTVSIDGAREQQDKHRVFSNGMGSYDIIVPRIKMLLDAAQAAPRRRARHAHGTESRRRVDLQAPVRGDRLLGGRLRAGDDVVAARIRDRGRRLPAAARADSNRSRRNISRPRSPGSAMASRTCATRSRRFTKA